MIDLIMSQTSEDLAKQAFALFLLYWWAVLCWGVFFGRYDRLPQSFARFVRLCFIRLLRICKRFTPLSQKRY